VTGKVGSINDVTILVDEDAEGKTTVRHFLKGGENTSREYSGQSRRSSIIPVQEADGTVKGDTKMTATVLLEDVKTRLNPQAMKNDGIDVGSKTDDFWTEVDFSKAQWQDTTGTVKDVLVLLTDKERKTFKISEKVGPVGAVMDTGFWVKNENTGEKEWKKSDELSHLFKAKGQRVELDAKGNLRIHLFGDQTVTLVTEPEPATAAASLQDNKNVAGDPKNPARKPDRRAAVLVPAWAESGDGGQKGAGSGASDAPKKLAKELATNVQLHTNADGSLKRLGYSVDPSGRRISIAEATFKGNDEIPGIPVNSDGSQEVPVVDPKTGKLTGKFVHRESARDLRIGYVGNIFAGANIAEGTMGQELDSGRYTVMGDTPLIVSDISNVETEDVPGVGPLVKNQVMKYKIKDGGFDFYGYKDKDGNYKTALVYNPGTQFEKNFGTVGSLIDIGTYTTREIRHMQT
jgi:hypothetical protein